MLYRLGVIILLLSVSFADSGSLLIPLGVASFGIALMIGGANNGKTDTTR